MEDRENNPTTKKQRDRTNNTTPHYTISKQGHKEDEPIRTTQRKASEDNTKSG